MLVIGIDPGVTTGLAAWNIKDQSLIAVASMPIHKAMRSLAPDDTRFLDPIALVLVEDARQRKWFGKSGKEVWQGAGSIKRDCTIWEDFLSDYRIPYVMTPPRAAKTKVNSVDFKRITGWEHKTNEHSRDAAMLVYGLTEANVRNYLKLVKES